MKKINYLLSLSLMLLFFFSCTSLDDQVKEYAAVKNEINQVYTDISTGEKDEEMGISEISELKEKLEAFDPEVLEQYNKEEEIRHDLEVKKREFKEESRRDSIKQARIDEKRAQELKIEEARKAREEEARIKAEEIQNRREVAAMIAAEEEADRNAYIEELKGKGMFLAEFDGEYYEVNQKEWNEWKNAQEYDHSEALGKYREMFASMGTAKANQLANSLYRTVSKKIASEGISYKAIEGIQVYNILTTGETQFE